ncbi:TetR/AcrR family transcriptional regulator [Nonomuraea jiangxiensis]|uniref:DNA-binding transcriptional regulator, AcrR family n=1 Tax=Nonomuraea jiangxiensis TaxID=633440 RepID=A0A1G9EH07_9ACTN|nr:TetR/AcrR family transcriptional regulator [Nonomuraea jiangxiensis]SDK75341.1 DNA-binding transcriptional regulator, AcrR family [Nonomuraea jiangxiensis]
MNAQVSEARPRDREATRERILQAARTLFGEQGYERVTVRMIASAAEANIALVGRYFGSKAGLFSAVLEGEPTFRALFDGPREGLPRRLAEYAAARMERPPDSPVLRTLERSAGHPEVQAVARERLIGAVLHPLESYLEGPDALARARMATSVVLGVAATRRRLGPVTATAADVDRLTAVFEACLAE